MNSRLKSGKYKHYKGTLYRVTGIAKHSETLEDMVVYHSIDEPTKVWVRPLDMFLENVDKDGYKGPRFEYIGE